MINLDYSKASRYLDQAVRERGADFVYQGPTDGYICLYVHAVVDGEERNVTKLVSDASELDGIELKPACLVGYVLHLAGVPLEKMALCALDAAELFRELENREILKVTEEAEQLLVRAQQEQDGKVPWGVAVKVAQAYTQGFGRGARAERKAVRDFLHGRG